MTVVQHAKDILASADLIHSAETVSAAVSRIAAEITEKFSETNPLLLCVMSGGVYMNRVLRLMPAKDVRSLFLRVRRGYPAGVH